jgi:hypothetical protein
MVLYPLPYRRVDLLPVQHSVRSQGVDRTCSGHPGINASGPRRKSCLLANRPLEAMQERLCLMRALCSGMPSRSTGITEARWEVTAMASIFSPLLPTCTPTSWSVCRRADFQVCESCST